MRVVVFACIMSSVSAIIYKMDNGFNNQNQFGVNLNPSIGLNQPYQSNTPIMFTNPIQQFQPLYQPPPVMLFQSQVMGGLYTDNHGPTGFDRLMGTTSEQAESFRAQPRFYADRMAPGDAVHMGGTKYIKQNIISRSECTCPGQGMPCVCSWMPY